MQLTRLSNGLRVVSETMEGMASVSVGIWVGIGSRYERKRLGGISHFLEHLLFKGTRKRSAKQITEEIEGAGGNLNAFTSEEHTCYTAKVHHRCLPKAVEVLSDMLLDSTLDPKEVERERNVIQEEIRMSQDNPGEYVQELLSGLIWPDQPLGRLVIGSSGSIRDMKRFEILEYKARHYVAGNMLLAAAGNVKHDALVALAQTWLGKAPEGTLLAYEPLRNGVLRTAVGIHKQKTEQVHIAMAFPGYARNHADRAAAKVLGTILGGNMSSRLFQEVREKRGLAYDIGSSVHHYHDTGSFVISAGVDPKKLLESLEVISKVLATFKKSGAQKQELERAKEYSVGLLTLAMEKTMDRMVWLGEWAISLGRAPELQAVLEQIKKVSIADVNRIARERLLREACCLQAIGSNLSASAMSKRLVF